MMQGGVNHGTLLPLNTHKILPPHPAFFTKTPTPGGAIFLDPKIIKKFF